MLRNSWHQITEIARKQGKFKRWNIIFNNLYQFTPGFAALGAFIISYFLLPIVISVSHDKHLFDDPSDSRKLHKTVVPNLGGVAIFVAVLLPFLLSGTALQA